jgi:UDP-N-acetylmuramoylalanine--D-glutamate ligase
MTLDPRSLFEGKRITVMGLGLLGRGLLDTLFLAQSGAQVTVTDLKDAEQLAPSLKQLEGIPIKLKLGRHDPEDFINSDMILRNADVPRSSPFLKLAADHGVPIEMDESLFCKHFEGTVVGITGTRGKTTTTILIHNILSADCRGRAGPAQQQGGGKQRPYIVRRDSEALPRVFLGGNVMGRATLPLLGKAGKGDTVVLELSSWQLQGFHDAGLSPNASLFTNIYPDHLNRYSGMEEYIQDKKAIYLYQKNDDFCVFNGDQTETARLALEAPARKDFFRVGEAPSDWDIKLAGMHNRENIAGAIKLTQMLGIPETIVRTAVESFGGVEHRLQWLGVKRGVGFVNDSTSTTPVSGCAALRSLDGKHILLIAGGADKKLDLQPFARSAATRADKIALLEGEATESLYDNIVAAGGKTKVVGRFDNLRDAVYRLLDEAVPGAVILLSPACASFGMFRNEFHRGETFINIFEEMSE